MRDSLALAQSASWKCNPCLKSATIYSTYLQLPSNSEGIYFVLSLRMRHAVTKRKQLAVVIRTYIYCIYKYTTARIMKSLLHTGFLLGFLFNREVGGYMSSETSDSFQWNIWRYIPEDFNYQRLQSRLWRILQSIFAQLVSLLPKLSVLRAKCRINRLWRC